jgi:ABC-type proline/glycine betaine transport system permease subunit
MEAADTSVPTSAAWLGGLGAAPFIGLAGAMPFLEAEPRRLVAHALVAYGATILSFLGGVHWGLAIGSPTKTEHGKLPARLVLSVIPSLAGWAALLVPEMSGLFILTVAIAAMLWIDIRATRAGQAPPWYPKLRVPLSGVVMAALLLGAIA